MPTLAELTTPLTRTEIEAAIYSAIEALGVKTTSWKPGAIARTIIAGTAIVLAAFSTLQARIAESGFLELAAGDWLTIVAREVYGVERSNGTFAAGNVTLTNTGGGLFTPGIGDVIFLNSTTGKTYRNTAAFVLNPFQVGLVVPVEAIEIGADSTAAPTDIDDFVTVLLAVTVTNPNALVGQDPETDAALRERCLAKTGVLSPNGPADAYRFLALSAVTTGGTPAGVTRVRTVPDGAGNVLVILATASGPVTGIIGDPSTPLGAANEAIQTQCVPLAVTATVQSAVASTIAVTYSLWVKNTIGLTVSQIQTQVATALAVFLSTQPISGSRKVPGPGFVFVEQLEGVIAEAVGASFLVDVQVTVPAANVAIASNGAPVLGTVTPTVTVVAP
jgi:hypothetical protein